MALPRPWTAPSRRGVVLPGPAGRVVLSQTKRGTDQHREAGPGARTSLVEVVAVLQEARTRLGEGRAAQGRWQHRRCSLPDRKEDAQG